jgi:hypothetical protein
LQVVRVGLRVSGYDSLHSGVEPLGQGPEGIAGLDCIAQGTWRTGYCGGLDKDANGLADMQVVAVYPWVSGLNSGDCGTETLGQGVTCIASHNDIGEGTP